MLKPNKYAGERCCVCGKYGAHPPFGAPLNAMKLFAKEKGLTLRLPESDAVHEKCFQKLKRLLLWKRDARV
jgi:hypothetical protein